MDNDFITLSEEVLKKLETLREEVQKAKSGEHGSKAAAKRARALMRELKKGGEGLFIRWIKASPK